MGKLKALICGRRTADSDPGSSDTEIPEKSRNIPKAPSTEDVEILRTRRFPYDRIAHIFGLGSCTGAEVDRIWHSDVTEAPDFLSQSL
jgi:hypothetical protein